jgi:hypothetical protein
LKKEDYQANIQKEVCTMAILDVGNIFGIGCHIQYLHWLLLQEQSNKLDPVLVYHDY